VIEDRLKALLTDGLSAAARELGLEPPFPEPELQRPRQKEFGDFTTNIAMIVASRSNADPRATAAAVVAALPAVPFLAKAEVAGPGFINLWTTDDWLHDVLRQVASLRAAGSRWSSCPRIPPVPSRSVTLGTPRSGMRSRGC
jgi:arginyl-tRNA synthetase